MTADSVATESLIGGHTVGLLHFPDDYANPKSGLLARWRCHVIANAVVRDRGYMEGLFKTHFPHGELAELGQRGIPEAAIEKADTVVLLYPDPIGLDFSACERFLASRWPTKRILVLNGRRRLFRLDRERRRRLALRRMLALFRPLEAAFFVFFVTATPFLLLVDLLRRRR